MKIKTKHLFVIVALICYPLSSCNSIVENTLDMAGTNQCELQKVLDHFENDSDPLKYEAAKFIIENLSVQYSMEGQSVNDVDSLYIEASKKSIDTRTKTLENSIFSIDASKASRTFDLNNIKAEYLIKAIDDACDAWNSSTWHNNFDNSIFFEYVLPYRLAHEPVSDWHKAIKEQFSTLSQEAVLSRRGLQFEAENGNTVDCSINDFVGASQHKAVTLHTKSSAVTFNIESERRTQKRMIIRYSSISENLVIKVYSNGTKIDTVSLAPTKNIQSFTEKWLNILIPITKGTNSITVSCSVGSLCLDYIQLGAIEQFKHSELQDFSENYYCLENANSHLYITYDTAFFKAQKQIRLQRHVPSDRNQLLRLDYAGYPLWRIGYNRKDREDICMQIEFGTSGTLKSGEKVSSDKYIKKPFDQWAFLPVGNNLFRIMNKHTGLFLDTEIESITGNEILVQKKYSETKSQKWLLHKMDKNPFADKQFKLNSATSEAMRVFDLTHQFEYYIYTAPYDTKASSLFKAKSGKCADETNFSVLLCRYLGIPSAVDFTPHWGNRSSSHSWSVIIDEKGKAEPFYMGNFPGDTAHYFHSYLKPKVFRSRYSLNEEISNDMKYEAAVPLLFQRPLFTDVTNEYCKTSDITRKIPEKYKDSKVVYICVFDNREWVPVFYGNVRWGKVTFKSMGRGIAYMMGIFSNGHIIPFGNPFILTNNGKVRELNNDYNKMQTIRLHRKYPFIGAQDFFNSRMNNGQFQGANNPQFNDKTVLHIHKGIANGNWYNITTKSDETFSYLRYIGGKGSYCNINELEFYDENDNKIEGTIIGTEGESWARKENVFDGNILTGFGALSPDGNWVGLKLNKPSKVSRIKYIGRNDGNCVEIGDTYELYCWHSDGYWVRLGIQKAKSNHLTFDNVPSNGLYILKDITKGVEERIFTYENGKQVWW